MDVNFCVGLCRFSGLDNAGKTTVLKKFNGEDINTISPTLGFNIKTLEFKSYKLNVWDVGGALSCHLSRWLHAAHTAYQSCTHHRCRRCCRRRGGLRRRAGQQTIRSYWRNYYEQTDGLVWVIDSADTRRLNDCKEELHKLLLQEVPHRAVLRLPLTASWMPVAETGWRLGAHLREQAGNESLLPCASAWRARACACSSAKDLKGSLSSAEIAKGLPNRITMQSRACTK